MLQTPIARYLRDEISFEEFRSLQGAERMMNNSLTRDGDFVPFVGDFR